MNIRIPGEWEPHECCWMAWAVHPEWADWVNKVKEELSEVIRTISQFETVRLLTPPHEVVDARARFSGGNVEIIEAPVDDIWMRDIAPTFAMRCGEVVAIDFNFNGWGNTKERPARPGDRLAASAEAIFDVPRICAPFIAEGGAMITDGDGTAISTESCLLNPNRNAYSSLEIGRRQIERGFGDLGIQRVIWLNGDTSEPLTSGHIDGYALFSPETLLVEVIDDNAVQPPLWRMVDIATAENSVDASERKLRVERFCAPRKRYWKYRGRYWSPCYLNAYATNGGVIAPCFGDTERDEAAKDSLARAFPGRTVEMLRINHIVNGGGGVHCLTQPMPVKGNRINGY